VAAPLYRLEDVAFAYPGGRRSPFRLEIDSLEVRAGEVLALVGPNGAGKTTLLSLLAFLIRPSSGRLEFQGADPWAAGERDVAARREAVLLTHHPYLFKGTVADNVAFGLKLRQVPDGERAVRVREALALVELDGWERRSASGLSAGQAQRVALARAFALRPLVLLLDEPTANLEAALGARLESFLMGISAERGTAVVLSTHNFAQASRLAGRVLYLSEGRRVEMEPGTAEALFPFPGRFC
jgi:tungstate transport system ATP-binding protein